MPSIGFWELIIILIVALVVLGPKRLPEAARWAGRGLRRLEHYREQFKQGFNNLADHAPPEQAPPSASSDDDTKIK